MSTVYILGSGFSASFGLPTLSELFTEIIKHERPGEDDVNEINDAVGFLYPHFKEQLNKTSYPPFEEFLSLVFATKDFEGIFFEEGYWNDNYIRALRLLTDCINSKTSNALEQRNDTPFRRFSNKLSCGDTIITFNWDTLLEKYLSNKKIDINLLGGSSSKINILKLHGSLSWQRLSKETKPKYPEYFQVLSEEENLIARKDYDYIDLWDALDEPPYIVTPIWHKTPLEIIFLRNIWYEAFIAMTHANKIIIIGYSLPLEDLHSRALIRTGIVPHENNHKEVVIIDPDPVIAGRYFSTITSKIKYFQRYFTGEELDQI